MPTQTVQDSWNIDKHDFPYGGTPTCRYEFLLRYATLAPSSHNSQPWLFKVSEDGIRVYADPKRRLPVVDPHNRAQIISCGAGLEYLCVSARFFGYEPHTDYENRDHHPDFLASFFVDDRKEPEPTDVALFNAIPNRHTNRNKFEDKAIPSEIIRELRIVAGSESVRLDAVTEIEGRQKIGRMINEGDRLQADDPDFRRELAAWIHGNRSNRRDGMPGYAHGFGDIASMLGPWIIRSFDWGDGQAAADERLVMGSPLLVILKTDADTKTDWLNTGRALAKVLLLVTHHGLSASFLNQPIEVEDLRPALKATLGNDGEPQVLLRIGYGPESQPTPRRPVEDLLVRSPK